MLIPIRYTLIPMLALVASQAAFAAPPKADPAELLQQAIKCDLPKGQSAKVSKALKKLSKTPNDEGGYVLPITVYGVQGTAFNVSNDDYESYSVVFPDAKLAQFAAAADLKLGAGGDYERKGKHGQLKAVVANRTEVWLFCNVY